MTEDKTPTWREVMDPIVKQMELAAKLDMNYVANPVGATAVAKLITKMADLIDNEINRRNELNRL